MRIFFFISALWLCLSQASGTDYRFRHLKNGLPHLQVEAFAEDDQGNIWIGTRNGLVRYDGHNMTTYYHQDSNPESIAYNFIKKLLLDSHGRLWVVTMQGGVSRYVPQRDSFVNYAAIKGQISSIVEMQNGEIVCAGDRLYRIDMNTDSLTQVTTPFHGYIVSLAADDEDNLYVCTNDMLCIYKAGQSAVPTFIDSRYYEGFLTGNDGIVPLCFDDKGGLWVGRNGKGAQRIDFRTGSITVYHPEDLTDGTVICISCDASGNIWMGTERGISVIAPNGSVDKIRHQVAGDDCLSDNSVYCIFHDRQRNVWVGSYFGGVDYLPNKGDAFKWFRPGNDIGSIKGEVPRGMTIVNAEQVWIATENGGINIFNPKHGTFMPFTEIPELGTNVHSLYYDQQKHEMWIGTFRAGLFRYNFDTHSYCRYMFSNGLDSHSVFAFACQHDGTLWVGTTFGLRRFDAMHDAFVPVGNEPLDHAFVYCMAVDDDDNLWVGTDSRGCLMLDTHSNKVNHWLAGNETGLRDNYITSLYKDSHGTLYVGTNNNGLQYYDPRSGKFAVVDYGNRLAQMCVCSIGEDCNHNLWVATSGGLFAIDADRQTAKRFTTDYGLPTNQFNFASSLLLPDSSMLIGTVNGLVSVNTRHLTDSAPAFDVHLLGLSIDGQRCHPTDEDTPLKGELDKMAELTLSYDQAHSFAIQYGVILPANGTDIVYQVMLKGIDNDWRDVGSERRFLGYNIHEGNYVLMIRAGVAGCDWNQCPVKMLHLRVLPPFYRSTCAYVLYLLLLGFVVVLAYWLMLRRFVRQSEERKKQMEQEKQEALSRSKVEFFTTVSHELRTPLSLIVAPLKSIKRDQLDETSNHHLDIALKNTAKMENLIGELVTFNKIESGQFPFYVLRANPLAFIEQVADNFMQAAAEKQVRLSVSTEDNGEEVWFSPSYLERITYNLLSNAIKFTPQDGDVMMAASIVQQQDGLYLQLVVADTGIGIASKEHDKIFNLYYQTQRGASAGHGGWGIGLSLVKRLVEVHKGKISLQSEEGQGTTFTIMLNVGADAFAPECYTTADKVVMPISEYAFARPLSFDEATAVKNDTDETASLPTLLLVEDDCDLRSFLADNFASHYRVLTACNGTEALEKAKAEMVNIVVSDVMMPEMDGIELCKRLKGDMLTSHIPIILLTAKTDAPDVLAGYGSGADAYVAKPFDPQILDLQVHNILLLVSQRQNEILESGEEEIQTSRLSSIDKDFIARLAELVDKNLSNGDFAVADVTDAMHISRSLLHRKMKTLVGLSITDYIRKRRIDYACQLLRSGKNVSETAYLCGFADPSHFSHTFKKMMGMAPKDYDNATN